MEKVNKEKEDIINNLLQRAKIQEMEKSKIVNSLKEKDAELMRAKSQLSAFMISDNSHQQLMSNIVSYFFKRIPNRTKYQLRKSRSYSSFNSIVKDYIPAMDAKWLEDCREENLIDDNYNLTPQGFQIFKIHLFKETQNPEEDI